MKYRAKWFRYTYICYIYNMFLPFSHWVMSNSLQPHGQQQATLSLSFTVSQRLITCTSIELVVLSNHLILCLPLLLLLLLVAQMVKNLPAMRPGFDPWVRKVFREENGYSLQYSCLENFMGRGAWRARVHGVTKSQTWLSD